MKKLTALIAFLFIGSFASIGQAENSLWSEEYEDFGYYTILGEHNGAIFLERKHGVNTNNRSVDIDLLRFDEELELSHAVEVKKLEKSSYTSIATIDTPEGIAHIYYQTSKRNEHFVSAQLFDHKDLHKTDIINLARFKFQSRSRQTAEQDRDFNIEYPLDVILSKDKTKLAIYFTQEKVGKSKSTHYQYTVIDIERGFQILYTDHFYSDNQSNKYDISDMHLSNNGRLSYAIKHYHENYKTEHINKRPAYDYEVYNLSGGDTTEYIYDIKMKKVYIDKLVLGSDDNDNLYISGYYRKKPFGDITGSYLLGLDHLGYEIFEDKNTYSKREIKNIQGKEGNHLDNDFTTLDILPSGDVIYIIRQYRQRDSRNSNLDYNNSYYGSYRYRNYNNFNRLEYHWAYDEVLIEGVGKNSGEVLWTVINPRQQEDDDYFERYFITGDMKIIDEDLYLFYNERIENLERIRKKEKVKRTDIPGDKTSFTIAKISNQGEIDYRTIEEEDHFHIPRKCVLLKENEIYFVTQNKNYRNYFLARMPIEAIQF